MKVIIIMMVMATVAMVVNGRTPYPQDLFLEEWKEFKLTYNKNYRTKEEEDARMKIFAENKVRIATSSQAFSRGDQAVKTGINQFSDTTLEEFSTKINGFRPRARNIRKQIRFTSSAPPKHHQDDTNV